MLEDEGGRLGDQAHRHELVAEQLRGLHRAVSGGLPRFIRRGESRPYAGTGLVGQFITNDPTLNERRAETLKREQRFELGQYRGDL